MSFNEVTGIDDDEAADEIVIALGVAYVANDPEDSVGAPTLGIRGTDRSKFDFQ